MGNDLNLHNGFYHLDQIDELTPVKKDKNKYQIVYDYVKKLIQ